MIKPSQMRHKVKFQMPVQVDDEQGGKQQGWADHVTVYAQIVRRYNGERVIADRLSGVQTATVTIYHSRIVDRVREDWRIIDLGTGEVFNIRTKAISSDSSMIEMLCQSGVAV